MFYSKSLVMFAGAALDTNFSFQSTISYVSLLNKMAFEFHVIE